MVESFCSCLFWISADINDTFAIGRVALVAGSTTEVDVRTASDFRRGGTFDMTPSPAVLEQQLQGLCFQFGFSTVEAGLYNLADRFHVSARPAEPRAEPSQRLGRRSGKPVTTKRSQGAHAAWRTRNAKKAYMEAHPGVTKEEALAAVRASQGSDPGTATAAEPVSRRVASGRKTWIKRVQDVIAEREAAGEAITEEAARKIVSDRMRANRTPKEAKTTTKAAA